MRGNREEIHLSGRHSFRVLRWSRNLRQVQSLLEPGRVERVAGEGTHWHYHAEMELTLFTSGEGTRFVGDHIGPFATGDLVLLGENLPHYWYTRGASSGISVQWNFAHGHPLWAFPETLSLLELFKTASRGLRFTGQTAAALATGLGEVARTGGTDRLGLLLRLLALMASAPASERGPLSTHVFLLHASSPHQQAMADAVCYLLANFRDEVRMDDLLELTGMSKATFSRQFWKHSGKTFSDFISHVRLQAACRDLVETDRSILEIALSSGFTQISFFNRIFRRILQCTPTEYRSRHRKREDQPALNEMR